jgi:hypothetical protein
MNKIVHYLGLDVHKETIAVSIAPENSTEVRRYGIIVVSKRTDLSRRQACNALTRSRSSSGEVVGARITVAMKHVTGRLTCAGVLRHHPLKHRFRKSNKGHDSAK